MRFMKNFIAAQSLLTKSAKSSKEKNLQLQLESRKLVKPRWSDQVIWMQSFSPNVHIDHKEDSWVLLQKLTMPLILQGASSYHLRGIQELQLNQMEKPRLSDFQAQVNQKTGWQLHWVQKEIEAKDYFQFLANKQFPCLKNLRPQNEILCGSQPDFWHEALGHIAPLVHPEVSFFYQRLGKLFVELANKSKPEKLKQLEKILWVLLEYGFVLESGHLKSFGAAVTGSYVAQIKWQKGFWSIQDFEIESILNSGLFEEDREAQRDPEGRLLFYQIPDFNLVVQNLEKYFLETSHQI